MHRILQVGLPPQDNLVQWLDETTIQSIVILEPHPQQVQQLQQQYSHHSKLCVVPKALSLDGGAKTLVDYTLPGFSSINPISGLKRFFPGIRPLERFEVETLSPAQFLQAYGPDPKQTASLVIQAKGAEADLLQALIGHPDLTRFTEIVLYSGAIPLYETSVDVDLLQGQLLDAGYELTHQEKLSTEWVRYHFKRNPLQDQIHALKQQLASKDQLIKEHAQSVAALQGELKTERQKAVTQFEQLTTELSYLKQVKQAAAATTEQLQSEIVSLKRSATEEKQKATKYAEQSKLLKAELAIARDQFQLEIISLKRSTAEEKQKAAKFIEQCRLLQIELVSLQSSATEEKQKAAKYAEQSKLLQVELATARDQLVFLKQNEAKAKVNYEELVRQVMSLQNELETERQKAKISTEQLTIALSAKESELNADKNAFSVKEKELNQKIKLLVSELDTLKKESAANDTAVAAHQKELKAAKESQSETLKQLEETQIKLKETEQWLRNRKKQVEDLEQKLKQEQDKNQQLQTEKTSLTDLEARLEQLFQQQKNQIQQATNALGQHVTKSFIDQRQHNHAITGLYQYLDNGDQPLHFDAWAMGVDTLTYLIRQIEHTNYDVIIEFGSGTSTVVLAKAVAQRLTAERHSQIKQNDSKKLAYKDIESASFTDVAESQAATLLGRAEHDLPRQLLSFEQDRNYLKQTQQALASHGVNQMVELVLAPLVPTRHSAQPAEEKPLFYDCEKHLERLARLFENRHARILVVVDGPASPKNNPLIREPALGTVLQYLAAHHLDVVLDDSHRSGEQQVLKQWKELCEQRGLSYQAHDLDVVKGATWLTVRPE